MILTEIALLFAQCAKGGDILKLILDILSQKTKEGLTLLTVNIEENPVPTFVDNKAHIDIGYDMQYQKPGNQKHSYIWLGIYLHTYQPPKIYFYARQDISFPNDEGQWYGKKEPEGSSLWIPLKPEHCKEIFEDGTPENRKKEILTEFISEVIKKM